MYILSSDFVCFIAVPMEMYAQIHCHVPAGEIAGEYKRRGSVEGIKNALALSRKTEARALAGDF